MNDVLCSISTRGRYRSTLPMAIQAVMNQTKKPDALVIFDDLVLDKNPKISEMFIRGRKLAYSMIYISQSFYQTDKIIRQNVNYIWLGRGMQKRDLNMILSEFALGMDKNELEQIYNELSSKNIYIINNANANNGDGNSLHIYPKTIVNIVNTIILFIFIYNMY